MYRGVIRIDDHNPSRNVLVVDLREILLQFEPEARISTWRASGVECTGDAAAEMHALSDTATTVVGPRLLDLASRIVQTIDGTFEGYWPGDTLPWVVIEAIDSSCFVVLSNSQQLLSRLRTRFREVSDIESWDEQLSTDVRDLQPK